jgi:hypothetical protein
MSGARSVRAFRRWLVVLAGSSLALIIAGMVSAGSGSPSNIVLDGQAGLTVQVSGTWSWPEMATATRLSYTGFAIDWGDVTSGNAVGSYHVGDGTAATNVVMQPTSPSQGASGNWGPVSHTYAAPGSYHVCVILYDLGEVKPFKTTGYHSLQAGGIGRNTDNSVDQNNQPSALCLDLPVVQPSPSAAPSGTGVSETPTPFESFQGFTAVPSNTPPSTGTTGSIGGGSSSGLPIALLLAFGSVAVLAVQSLRLQRQRKAYSRPDWVQKKLR